MKPPPASVAHDTSVQIAVATTTSAGVCNTPSMTVSRLVIDVDPPQQQLQVTLPQPIETACDFTFTQPGLWS